MKRLVAVSLIAVFAALRVVRAEPFKDGETVCFIGDSITHGGPYHAFIRAYYLTRFPDQTIQFVNAGTSGETAGGGAARFDEDVLPYRPTSAVVMFGMNDVNRGAYVANPDEKKLAAQKQALDGYQKNMEKLVERIQKEAGDPKLLFITPSPYDDTVVTEQDNNQPGCNHGLGRCADIVRELASKNNATLVDFHGPMTAFNLEQQKKDPKYTIVEPGRVHPGAPGHLMMAWLFLKAQGAPSVVSTITVDAATGRALERANAEVTAVAKKAGGVSFTVLEKALPFPIHPKAKELLELLPIEKDLNQEMLFVSGLATGRYELKIDGAAVGQYSAEALAKGINLAFNGATPQYKQAQRVFWKNEEYWRSQQQKRNLVTLRWYMKNRLHIDVDNLEAVQAYYDKIPVKKNNWGAGMTLNYIKNWSRLSEIEKQSETLWTELDPLRKPVAHLYEIGEVR